MSTETAAVEEWHRFLEVTKDVASGHKLYRASSPNYMGGDKTQKLTGTATRILTDHNIDSVISFNQYSYTDAEKKLLSDAKIAYLHLPVIDFHAAALDQLRQAITFFKNHNPTLIHCGYGHGRTGTGVTALHLDFTKGQQPLESVWQSENHVEKPEQMDILRTLRDSY